MGKKKIVLAQIKITDVVESAANNSKKWQLVTNQRNLMYMLAAGIIMSPKGFGNKYYKDTLSNFPGWIPLFAEIIPKSAIDLSLIEKPNLIPCLLTININALHGELWATYDDCPAKQIQFPEGLNGKEKMLFVPAPLPVSWIEAVSFNSPEDRSSCENDARDFGNIPLLDFKRDIDQRSFSKTDLSPWPPEDLSLSNSDSFPGKSFAYGGIMAMLLHMGNLGDEGVQACRIAFAPEDLSSFNEPIIKNLGLWLQTGKPIEDTDKQASLFWGVVDSIVGYRSSDETPTPIDAVLGYLEEAENMMADKYKDNLSKLSNDLKNLAGFSDTTVSELFKNYPKPFSRALIIFFLREKCVDLIEFRHPALNDIDYVAAAILFGARDGWLGLPLTLRDIDGLAIAVSFRMAVIAHRLMNSGIKLGEVPARPMPLRELFIKGERGWSQKQKEAALVLARDQKWSDCINTRINLGKGSYQLVIDGCNVQILLPGEVKAVVTEVDSNTFLEKFGTNPIVPKIEKKVRSLLIR